MMRKIGKIISIAYLAFFVLLTASSLYDGSKRGRYEEAFLMIIVFGLPIFFYFWFGLAKTSLQKYLTRFAGYDAEKLQGMSLDELKKRRELYRLNTSANHTQTPKDQLSAAIKQEREVQKGQPGVLGQFLDGYNDATAGSKGFYGTYGKRMVCVNCGQRMSKHFGMWSTSHQCQQAGRKCVPYEAPEV